MSNPFRAIGGAYGQKWAFWAKNGRFRVSGDPRCHFLGALKAQTGHPGCVWQCPTLFNQCPTHLEPLEVPMAENGLFGKIWPFLEPLEPPGAIFWGPWGPKQVTLDVFDNVQPCPTNVQPIWSRWRCLCAKMAIIGRIWPFFGQKWVKNGEIWWAQGWTLLCLTKEKNWHY